MVERALILNKGEPVDFEALTLSTAVKESSHQSDMERHEGSLSLNYGGSTSIDFLYRYKWSSFQDYIGVDNFPSITERAYILEIFGGESMYRLHIEKCLNEYSKEDIHIKLDGAIPK